MKYLFFLLLTLTFSKSASSQNAFQSQSLYTGNTVNGYDLVLPTYLSNTEVEGKPYFNKEWVNGSVTTTDKQVFSKKLLFMYDKVSGKLYFKNKDSATIMEADANKMYSFTLITDKPHIFINGNFFGTALTGKFVEALVWDEKKYSLLKYTTTSYEEVATSKAAQALTQTISNGRYVDKTTYYLFYNGALQPVEIKKKTFAKEMGNNSEKAEAYIKSNTGSFNESYVISMLGEINYQIQ